MEDVAMTNEQQCKNCGSVLDSKFCKNCGQKAIGQKQTIWQAIMHFVSDVTHYDRRFIKTLKLLLTRPGYLSSEYKNGVRQKYVDPIRLYLFISAVTFVIVIATEKHQDTITKISNPELVHFIDSTRYALLQDTAYQAKLERIRYYTVKTTAYGRKIYILEVSNMLRHGERYYDSVQNTLAPEKRSNGYKRYKEQKIARGYEVYDTAPYNYSKKILDIINLKIPKSFLFTMPFCILGLYVLNYKRRREYPSAYHAIFVMHYFAALWFFVVFDSVVSRFLDDNNNTTTAYDYLTYIIYIGWLVYLYVAMLRFYKDNWWVTLIKAFILTVFTGFMFYHTVLIMKEYFILSLVSLPA